MTAHLIPRGGTEADALPLSTQPGCPYAGTSVACAHCDADPMRVNGNGARWTDEGETTLEAVATCYDCQRVVGDIHVVVGGTIFGRSEDLAARAEIEERGGRVYGGGA